MAASATFRRNVPPAMSTDHDGSDTRVGVASYQMVPVGGQRPGILRVSGGVIGMVSVKPDIADFSVAPFQPGNFIVFDHQTQTDRDFTINGKTVGRTEFVAVDADGKPIDRLIVSVKSERSLTYNLHCLQDLRRKTIRTLEELGPIMEIVEKVYLKQANVRLNKVNERRVTFVKEDLGDPINTSVPFSSLLSVNVRDVIKKKIAELGLDKQNINFIATWNLISRTGDLLGFTPDFGKICLIEEQNSSLEEANTYAHELGHALGLLHDDQPATFLMNGGGASGFQITGSDIDQLNPSGLI